MTDLNRFIDGIQQLRIAMKATGMEAADVAIQVSADDGSALEHMIRQSEQVMLFPASAKEPVGHSRHVVVAGVKVWWLAS